MSKRGADRAGFVLATAKLITALAVLAFAIRWW